MSLIRRSSSTSTFFSKNFIYSTFFSEIFIYSRVDGQAYISWFILVWMAGRPNSYICWFILVWMSGRPIFLGLLWCGGLFVSLVSIYYYLKIIKLLMTGRNQEITRYVRNYRRSPLRSNNSIELSMIVSTIISK